jgi:cell division septum initiation protein DivIVA
MPVTQHDAEEAMRPYLGALYEAQTRLDILDPEAPPAEEEVATDVIMGYVATQAAALERALALLGVRT